MLEQYKLTARQYRLLTPILRQCMRACHSKFAFAILISKITNLVKKGRATVHSARNDLNLSGGGSV